MSATSAAADLSGARLRRLVIAAALGLGIGFGLFQLTSMGFDGDAYWNAALRLRSGAPLYLPGSAADPLVYRYPPWFAWAWTPLTYLPHDAVMAAWRGGLVLAALSLVPPLWPTWRGRAGLALFVPMLVTAGWMGNVQPAVVTLAVYGMRRPALLGIAAGVKAFPLALVGMFAWRREWRAAAVVVGVAALLWLPILLYPLDGYATARAPWPTDLALLLALLTLTDRSRSSPPAHRSRSE